MAGIVGLVNAISNDVVAKIAAGGLPALNDGKIVIGPASKNEIAFAPRVIFNPQGMRWAPPSPGTNASPINPLNPNAPGCGIASFTMRTYGGGYAPGTTVTISAPDVAGGVQAQATADVTSNGAVRRLIPSVAGSGYLRPPTVTINGVGTGAVATANLRPTPQALTVMTARPILTEWHRFLVEVWGINSVNGQITPDPQLDYDATQQLYQQVIASAHALAAGVHAEAGGQWLDALPNATTIDVAGRGMRFTLEIATPLLSDPILVPAGASTQYAPVNTQSNPTLTLQPISGSTPNP